MTGNGSARARKLAGWLGVTSSLNQSGESSSEGSITKTGSPIARRLLVEAAWHYARPPRIGVTLKNRQAGQPDHVLQIASRAQHRLHRVHHRLRERGKPGNVATIAVARELAGSSGPPPTPHDLTAQRSGIGLLGPGPGRRHTRFFYGQP